MKTKICKQCNVNKKISEFYIKKDTKDGYTIYCKICKSTIDKKYRLENCKKLKKSRKNYYNNNKETLKKKNLIYVNNNKKTISEYQKQYRLENADKKKETNRNYKANNREKLNLKERERNKKEPVYRLKNIIRKSILKKIKQQGFTKKNSTTNILGCTIEEFKIHIESQFLQWMNWNNHGLYNGEFNFGWDLDHIKPISSATTEEEVIRLNHYTNFRPLCSKINRDIKWKY